MTNAIVTLVIPCFNNGAGALATVMAIDRLLRSSQCELEAIIVDDGSTEPIAESLTNYLPQWARIIRTPQNLGRAAAINLGVAGAAGDTLLIMDSDCLPASDVFLQKHQELLTAGADASIGNIVGHTQGFWGRYQSQVASLRAASANTETGIPLSVTTANMLLRTAAFRAIEGFDPRYRHYGFEDRDFLLRLHLSGARMEFNPNAVVDHATALDFHGISAKMQSCGRYSAPLFRADHPAAYRTLGYAAMDASIHPWFAGLALPISRFVVNHTGAVESILHMGWLPYFARAWVARTATALAFMHGTRSTR